MRRFHLVRQRDKTGISGEGVVAEGAISTTGRAVLFWLTHIHSVAIYDTLDALLHVHGHGGSTRVVWLDPAPRAFISRKEGAES
jgi:hypothetical protein